MNTNHEKFRMKSFDMRWYYPAHQSGGGGHLPLGPQFDALEGA